MIEAKNNGTPASPGLQNEDIYTKYSFDQSCSTAADINAVTYYPGSLDEISNRHPEFTDFHCLIGDIILDSVEKKPPLLRG